MAIQVKKTYRDINPEMLCDEIRGLLHKQGVVVVDTESHTYGLPSGATQSRITFSLKTQAEHEGDQKKFGSVHVIGSPGDEAKMLLDIDESLFSKEKVSAFQGDLDFILGSHEVKW